MLLHLGLFHLGQLLHLGHIHGHIHIHNLITNILKTEVASPRSLAVS